MGSEELGFWPVKLWFLSMVWRVEKTLFWKGKQGCSLGIGMCWEKFLLSQGIKHLLEPALLASPLHQPQRQGALSFSLEQRSHLPTRTAAAFLCQKERGKKEKGKATDLKRAVNIFTVWKGYFQHIWTRF